MGKAFAARLHEAAAEANDGKGVIPAAIARELKVTRATVSHWFSGRSDPNGASLSALADLLRVRWQWLARGQLPKRPSEPGRSAQGAAESTTTHEARPYEPVELAIMVDGMELTREALEIAKMWMELPGSERQELKRRIKERVKIYGSENVPDERLGHLAAPGTPTAQRAAKAGKKKPTPAGTQ
jgi:transcriptional regulator with XRE-family HTH domain